MVPVILIDECLDGHAELLDKLAHAPPWTDLFDLLSIEFARFRDVGLPTGTPDDVIWRFCQSTNCVLITSNRTEETDDSLGEMIRHHNTPISLPVLTIGSVDRMQNEALYRAALIEQFYEYIFDLENYLGTGRLYLP